MATATTTVREIALENPSSIRVFEKLGIDYCCGGRKPLAEACQERSLDPAAVLAVLEEAAQPAAEYGMSWTTASLESLCAHIVTTHHEYVRREIPRLKQFAQKVVSRHGDTHPELPRIQQLVIAVADELTEHLGKEEAILFPYITNLERNIAACGPPSLGCFGTVRNPVQMMMSEHDAAGEKLAQIHQLSDGYTAPEGACPTYRGFYQALSEFERDLHQHIHLENNILFPRAIELEERFG